MRRPFLCFRVPQFYFFNLSLLSNYLILASCLLPSHVALDSPSQLLCYFT
ncbi:uncharacterized protein DEA37_0001852 [Paragonimus westermani]|uniref:Uncharacterized protein n=1 Tax=Paragonimus westermani TaxID=34504 RepID=A0A5J4NTC4_9TREM|nr:uncharacterized protein DEA37_0001852 [Paragonimus westermani]